MLTDSVRGYGRISQALHWATALLVALIIPSVIAYRIAGEHNFITVFLGPMHRPTGLILWCLGVTRVLWAFSQRKHRPTHTGRAGLVARLGHASLYTFLVVTPVLGLLVDWGSGRSLTVFGVSLFGEGPEVGWAKAVGGALHLPFGWIMCSLVLGHIVMALYHHFVLRDDTVGRMTRANN